MIIAQLCEYTLIYFKKGEFYGKLYLTKTVLKRRGLASIIPVFSFLESLIRTRSVSSLFPSRIQCPCV